MDWRARLYESYVTSGQARLGPEGARAFYRVTGPMVRHVIRKHMPAEKSARIVDLGCGVGSFVHWLREAGYTDVQGYDLSAEMVEAAHAAGVTSVQQSDMTAVLAATPDASVDAYVVFDVLEHLPTETLFSACDDIARTLKPGGTLVAHVPNAGAVFGALVRYGDLTHERAFAPSSIRQLLMATGLAEVRCYEDVPVVKGGVSAVRFLLWHLLSLWHRVLFAAETGVTSTILSQNMLVVARKPRPPR